MCVLTFFPLSEGFVITNNRDENHSRPKAIPPKKYKVGEEVVYFPKDSKAGGTWIAVNRKFTLCLLNGALEKHISKPPYLKSRGKVILDFLNKNSSPTFTNECFFGVENFTLVVIENQKQTINEFIWDGKVLISNCLDWKLPKIWSSSTLYKKEIRDKRADLFQKLLLNISDSIAQDLLNFHQFGDVGNIENNLVMQRADGTITQSISQIIQINNSTKFIYKDLLEKKHKSLLII